jgi:hypothetical protein
VSQSAALETASSAGRTAVGWRSSAAGNQARIALRTAAHDGARSDSPWSGAPTPACWTIRQHRPGSEKTASAGEPCWRADSRRPVAHLDTRVTVRYGDRKRSEQFCTGNRDRLADLPNPPSTAVGETDTTPPRSIFVFNVAAVRDGTV